MGFSGAPDTVIIPDTLAHDSIAAPQREVLLPVNPQDSATAANFAIEIRSGTIRSAFRAAKSWFQPTRPILRRPRCLPLRFSLQIRRKVLTLSCSVTVK